MIRFLPLADGPRGERQRHFLRFPVRFLLITVFFRLWFDEVGPTVEMRALFEAKTLFIVAMTWTLMGVVDLAIGRV